MDASKYIILCPEYLEVFIDIPVSGDLKQANGSLYSGLISNTLKSTVAAKTFEHNNKPNILLINNFICTYPDRFFVFSIFLYKITQTFM